MSGSSIGGAGVQRSGVRVLRRLRYPGCARMCGGAQDADPATAVFDHREHVHPCPRQGDCFHEVARQQGISLAAKEGGPGTGVPLGRRVDACLLQDFPDGGRAHLPPSTSSSPCRRRYPQLGFSFARRSTRMRMERTVRGLPGRLGRQEAAVHGPYPGGEAGVGRLPGSPLSRRAPVVEAGAGNAEDSDALEQARACNEIMIAIWLQVWALKDTEGDGYPDSEFLPILLGKADAGNARSHLRVESGHRGWPGR
ncbi:hypothetical protein SANTM175S_05545 [Streptomyces antimycoticus]